MKGRTVFRNGNTGITVTVSKPAEALIGAGTVPEFVRLLTEWLEIVGAKRAYVGKSGFNAVVYFTWLEGKPETWKIPVER